jgi:leucyl-tRNA synthetase
VIGQRGQALEGIQALGAGEEEISRAALENDKVQAHTAGKQVVKTIVIPGRLVSFVVK